MVPRLMHRNYYGVISIFQLNPHAKLIKGQAESNAIKETESETGFW